MTLAGMSLKSSKITFPGKRFHVLTSVTCTAVLDVSRAAAEHLAKLLAIALVSRHHGGPPAP